MASQPYVRSMSAAIRQELLSRLRTEWKPQNVDGWDPTLPWGDNNRLYAHLGEYDDTMPEPQLTLTDVSSDERNGGVSGWKSDGSGIVQVFDVVIQLSTWVDESVTQSSEALADELAREVREIVHDQRGLLTSVTNDLYSDHIVALSYPRTIPEPNEQGSYQATFDIGVRIREDPPER